MAEALDFGACFHQHVLGHGQPEKASMRPLGATNGRLLATGNDHEEIHIAVSVGLPPCLGTKEPDFFWRKLNAQPRAGFFQEGWQDRWHGEVYGQRA